jgi:hypothetical protein
MSFRTYSGPRGASPVTALEKDRALFKEFDTLDDALGWARHLDARGLTALLIEGDDGTHMTKQEIVAALHHAESAPLRKSS